MVNKGPLVFRAGAICNWVVTLPAIIAPETLSTWFSLEAPLNHPFLVRIWSGMAFMFGCVFWEIAKDMRGKRPLMKYAWIEKCVTALSVTVAFLQHEASPLLFALIIVTDWFWIPLFLFYHLLTRGGVFPGASRHALGSGAVRAAS